MNEVQSPDVLSLRGFVAAILGHKFKVFFAFVIVLAMTCVYVMNRSREYESSSKLFVRKGRETMTIDPTAAASGKVMSMTDTQDREVNSIVSILRNRELLEQVVDEIGPQNILEFEDEPSRSGAKQKLAGLIGEIKTRLQEAGILETVSLREQAVAALRDGLLITGGNGSAVIKVSVTADSPKLAQMLNQAIIDGYYRFHMLANSASGSFEFFDEQADKLSEELEQASQQLANMKIENNIISLSVKKDAMETQLQSIDNLLLRSKSDLAASRSKIQALNKQLDTSFTEIHQQLRISLLTEEANEASLVAQIEEAQLQRQKLSEEIDELNRKEYQLVELERQVDILDANYRQYIDNLEQVRINRELEDRKISNVNVFQQPSFVDYPVGPSNKVILALGLILALSLSCMVGVISELLWPYEVRRAAAETRRQNRQRRRPTRRRQERPVEADATA